MSPTPIHVPADLVELLDDAALSLNELARGCAVSPDWVYTHVEAGVLQPTQGGGAAEWRFASTTLVRARRIAQLEELQKKLLTQAAAPTPFAAPPVTEKNKPDPTPTGADLLDASKAIATATPAQPSRQWWFDHLFARP